MDENNQEIIFKTVSSIQFSRYWYVQQVLMGPTGSYVPIKKFLNKDGAIGPKLIPPSYEDTNYFKTEQDATDTINEFYSVVETRK